MKRVIKVHDKEFSCLLEAEAIEQRVSEMAEEISRDFHQKDMVIVGVLNGAFMFLSDLVKKIDQDPEVNFVKVASYTGTATSGKVRELMGFSGDIKGRDVLLIDDILDKGHTLSFLLESIQVKKPASVRSACLLQKPKALKRNVKADYVGFEIEDLFVLGYGLDYNQKGRTFNAIYQLNS